MTNEDAREIYDRLRETEAQTRAQNERIEALTARVDSMLSRWDTQTDRMWRAIYILVGALLALALGPRVAEKIVAASGGVACMRVDIAPWHPEGITWTRESSC